MKKNTIIINFFGAPGSGKSTGAAYLFSQLKMNNVDCEYVHEYAKDLVWQNHREVFENPENQYFIGANQFFRMNSLLGKVDVIVTDSPLLLSIIYNKSIFLGQKYNDFIINLFKDRLDGINLLVNWNKDYNSNGRNQTKEEAAEIHTKIVGLLDENNIEYEAIDGSPYGYRLVLEKVLATIRD
jgi:nicotinamide riboside kinase